MIEKSLFGYENNQPVNLFTLSNDKVQACVSDYGAVLVSLKAKKGDKFIETTLGYDDLNGYQHNVPFFGCVILPSANRTKNGAVPIDGVIYHLPINNHENNLHTDHVNGAHRKLWQSEVVNDKVVFTINFEDGLYGLPGNRKVNVEYTLTENGLAITYKILSDKKTLFAPTNHAYFNFESENIYDYEVTIDADRFTVTDNRSIPTGELREVTATPFDFRISKKLGKEINDDYEQLKKAGGYDHNFVFNNQDFSLTEKAKVSYDGLTMHIATQMPGMQLYTANFLEGEKGRNNESYLPRKAVCFETQFYPDSVNHPDFPSPLVEAFKQYSYTTVYSFTTE